MVCQSTKNWLPFHTLAFLNTANNDPLQVIASGFVCRGDGQMAAITIPSGSKPFDHVCADQIGYILRVGGRRHFGRFVPAGAS
jgi:hypothetical protein